METIRKSDHDPEHPERSTRVFEEQHFWYLKSREFRLIGPFLNKHRAFEYLTQMTRDHFIAAG